MEQHELHQEERLQNDISSGSLAQLQYSKKKSICLFGLSADPPTGYGGHVGIVQTLQQKNQWDEIWVMPVYRHTYQVCMYFSYVYSRCPTGY